MNRADFVSYLENTLIPDSKESGHEGYAQDLTEAVEHIKTLTVALRYIRDRKAGWDDPSSIAARIDELLDLRPQD
jgi:hypothetical protein